MKHIIILFLLMMGTVSYSQTITRGPEPGEIYFLGPTHTGEGLYYSTDFGETAVCVDSMMNILTIAGDKTSGGIYCIEMPSNLYYSDNHGQTNSWNYKNSGVNYSINSGRVEGEIYASFYKHSNDYGLNFIFHTCNGFFGDRIDNKIDNEADKGYILVYEPSFPDSIFLLYSSDNFENIQIQNSFINDLLVKAGITQGNNFGEIYINIIRNNYWGNWILHSIDFGITFDTIDEYNLINSHALDVEGGRQDGEIYILFNFVNQLWFNAHSYIYHSTNYGKTFEVYHPFSKGNEPILANFSTVDKVVLLTEPVEFSNFSIGEIAEYQWDFENDGIIDSYDEFPIHVYPDTGYYSVSLTVVGQDSSNTFVKENYIHIIDTATRIKKIDYRGIKIFPNPFTDQLTIEVSDVKKFNRIEIFKNQGEIVYLIDPARQINVWNGRNNAGQKCTPGIYYLKIHHNVYKVILTK